MRAEWRIRTKNSGVIVADYAVDDSIPEYARGESMTMTFKFNDGTFAYSEGVGAKWGRAEWGRFQYASADVSRSAVSRYRALRDFGDFADAAAYGMDRDHIPWYREQLPSSAPYDSQVVALEPGRDLSVLPGLWALIIGVTDQSSPTLAYHKIELELWVLAERDEYADHAAVEAALAE